MNTTLDAHPPQPVVVLDVEALPRLGFADRVALRLCLALVTHLGAVERRARDPQAWLRREELVRRNREQVERYLALSPTRLWR